MYPERCFLIMESIELEIFSFPMIDMPTLIFSCKNSFRKYTIDRKKEGKIFSPKDLIYELGLEINDENSIYYWAAKNNIPVFCPGIVDGSLGDMIVFFKQSHPDFILDVSREVMDICRLALTF